MKNRFLIFLSIIFSLTVFFNFIFIDEIFSQSKTTIPINDGVVNEFIVESEYQNLKKRKNPFTPNNNIFYPFGGSLVFSDTSATHLPFFILLRPLIDTHSVTLIIVLGNIILANVLMFFLLQKLGVSYRASVIGSLVFGFSPFVSYRVLGHYTYTAHYIFPLLFLTGYELVRSKKPLQKNIIAVLFGVFIALAFYANPYYFIMAGIAGIFICAYSVIFYRVSLLKIFRENVRQLPFIIISIFIVMVPWIIEAFKYLSMYSFVPEKNLIRSLILSADVMSFVIPGEFNPIYDKLFRGFDSLGGIFSKLSYFYYFNWDKFAYPGILILLSFIAFFFLRKRIDKKKLPYIKFFLTLTICFAILTLGPFLKIFNRWSIELDEGINIYFPLPYLMFTFVPGLSVLTVPARFIAIFVFFGSIFTSLMTDTVFNSVRKKWILFLMIAIVGIFFVDQMYLLPRREPKKLPVKAYEYIRRDSGNFTVLEIPYLVRDGLRYIGDVHATSIMAGAILHKKPLIGGYFARVDESVLRYYKELPFIGHVSTIIDKGNYHLDKEEPKEPVIRQFNDSVDSMIEVVNFLDIKYILLKDNEKYSELIRATINKLGYKMVMNDSDYTLYVRVPEENNFDTVVFGRNDYLFIGLNFREAEKNYRWGYGKSSTVFIKTYNPKRAKLVFEIASFFTQQAVKVYINNNYITTIDIHTKRSQYEVSTMNNLKKGINTITFVFSSTLKPMNVIAGNLDDRDLSAQFYSLKLE